MRLTPGAHRLTAEAPERGESFQREFSLTEERWASLSYWGGSGGPETFGWHESDEPLAYM